MNDKDTPGYGYCYRYTGITFQENKVARDFSEDSFVNKIYFCEFDMSIGNMK
jgi:hypothetical protein